MKKRLFLIGLFLIIINSMLFAGYIDRVLITAGWTEIIPESSVYNKYTGTGHAGTSDIPKIGQSRNGGIVTRVHITKIDVASSTAHYEYTVKVTTPADTIEHPAIYAEAAIPGSNVTDPDILEGDPEGTGGFDDPEDQNNIDVDDGDQTADDIDGIDGDTNAVESFFTSDQEDQNEDAEDQVDTSGDENTTVLDTEVVDPVRISSGSFVTSNTDLSISYFSNSLTILRNYRSNGTGYRSLGPGWSSNLDQRIIFGIENDPTVRVSLYEQHYNTLKGFAENARAMYDKAKGDLTRVLADATQLKTDLTNTVNALQKYLNNNPGTHHKMKAKLNADIVRLTLKRDTIIMPFIDRAQGTLAKLLLKLPIVEKLEAKAITAKKNWEKAEKIQDMSTDQNIRNIYNQGSNVPESWLKTGINSVTFIDDDDGVPHLFFTETEPDLDGLIVYPNGAKNYFPEGATYKSHSPSDYKVTLFGNGKLELVHSKTNIVYSFNYWGLLESITDINGNAQTFVYNENNWTLDYIIDDFGRKIDVTISGGRLVSVTDPLEQSILYTYDSQGRLETVTDRDGDTITYKYSGNLLTEIIKPDESSRKYRYEYQDGRTVVVETEDEEGSREYLAYDFLNRVTFVTSNEGVVTKHYYNNLRLETKVVYPDNSAEYKEYDEDNNLTKYTSRTGNTTTFQYDENRNVLYVNNPDGTSESRLYNQRNQVTSYINSEGNQFSFEYDYKGNMIRTNTYHANTSQPDSYSIYDYDEYGKLTSVTQGPHNTGGTVMKQISYDQYGNIDYLIDGELHAWDYEYDLSGQLKSTTDPEHNKTAYTYTGNGKIKTVTYPDTTVLEYEYTNRKDIDYIIHQDKTITDLEYDNKHRLKFVLNAEGEKTEYAYRKGESIKSIKFFNTDGVLAAHTEYEYEYMTGELIREKCYLGDVSEQDGSEYLQWRQDLPYNTDDRDWVVTDYSYKNGMLESVTDPRGYETYFLYNQFDRIQSVSRYGEPGQQAITEYFNYNAKGELEVVKNARGYDVTCPIPQPIPNLCNGQILSGLIAKT